MRELLFLLLVLACPLAMFLMMRGGHGHGGHSHTTSASANEDQRLGTEELRRLRGELDRLIEERERAEAPIGRGPGALRPTHNAERSAGVRVRR